MTHRNIHKLCFLLLFMASSAFGQGSDARLLEALKSFFSAYRLPNYNPREVMQMDSFRTDEKERKLYVYANEPFCSQPFTPSLVASIRKSLQMTLPQPYNAYALSILDKNGWEIEELIPNALRKEDEDRSRLWGDIRFNDNPWVANLSRPYAVSNGLEGRHLFIWPSHGRYYKANEDSWTWQRPYLFCTTEDLFTQSIVYPYLFPMLEKAGAIVGCPRERDTQTEEIIVDNDTPAINGLYLEEPLPDMTWETSPDSGFARKHSLLHNSDKPFKEGTTRFVRTSSLRNRTASVSWTPHFEREGRYAVYVAYESRPNSVSDARYTVYHKGGRTQFRVNQKIGGSTWVYLGTYSFDAGQNRNGRVVLNNLSDYRGVVSADAVRFGGGMGRCERGNAGISRLPRFLEAARYYAQWAGMPDEVYNSEGGADDYVDDIRTRSYMCNYLGGRSPFQPGNAGQGVPFELALALHSDAGVRYDNSVYGTLGICTTADSRGFFNYASGLSRRASRDFADLLVSSVVRDLSATFRTQWTRREIWDRNYGETRSPNVPSAIVEMLSHQNFTDMRYGHDPHFKFALARSLYKGILQFVSHEHGLPRPVVQPLPVRKFSALLVDNEEAVQLSWAATEDSLEASAQPTGYVVYVKENDGDFDNGRLVTGSTELRLPVYRGIRYAFRVTAVNEGGESFPSETLTAYSAPQAGPEILIVNGFTRLSGPAVVDVPDSLGFDIAKDPGVPYLFTTAFCGQQVNFDRSAAGQEGPSGLGFSTNEREGETMAGNTFNYTESHGKAIAASERHSYSSCSREAFCDAAFPATRFKAIDYIAGLERDVPYNLLHYKSFDKSVRRALSDYCAHGGNVLVSGSYIGSDMRNGEEKRFVENVLKYRYSSPSSADISDQVNGLGLQIPLYLAPNAEHYAAIRPDAIYPADKRAFSAFAYSNGQSAGIACKGTRYNVIAIGFPFECISDSAIRAQAMQAFLRFLVGK